MVMVVSIDILTIIDLSFFFSSLFFLIFYRSTQSSSEQSRSQPHSIVSTLVVISSDEDTGNQSVASRARSQRARQRISSTAPPIEIVTNDPPPTSQPTVNNPLTDLQDRQRAPQKQLSRCLEDGTRIDLSLSEISDEEVDYGSSASTANSASAHEIKAIATSDNKSKVGLIFRLWLEC